MMKKALLFILIAVSVSFAQFSSFGGIGKSFSINYTPQILRISGGNTDYYRLYSSSNTTFYLALSIPSALHNHTVTLDSVIIRHYQSASSVGTYIDQIQIKSYKNGLPAVNKIFEDYSDHQPETSATEVSYYVNAELDSTTPYTIMIGVMVDASTYVMSGVRFVYHYK